MRRAHKKDLRPGRYPPPCGSHFVFYTPTKYCMRAPPVSLLDSSASAGFFTNISQQYSTQSDARPPQSAADTYRTTQM